MRCTGKRRKVGGNLGSFPSFAVHSLISCMESLLLSVFSILYIRTVCSPSQRFWWMRHWSMSFVFPRGKALWEGRLWYYRRIGGKQCCEYLARTFLRCSSLWFPGKGEGCQKLPSLWQSWNRILCNMFDWSVSSILWCSLSPLQIAKAH